MQVGDHVARADIGLADQKVEMLGNGLDPGAVAECEVVAAKVDHGEKRAEDRDGSREELSRVEKAEAERGVKLLAKRHEVAELGEAHIGGQALVVAAGRGEGGQLMDRQRDFVV